MPLITAKTFYYSANVNSFAAASTAYDRKEVSAAPYPCFFLPTDF